MFIILYLKFVVICANTLNEILTYWLCYLMHISKYFSNILKILLLKKLINKFAQVDK